MSVYWTNGISTLYQADARDLPLPDKSVHCVVTSPPYFGLRNYHLGEWVGGDPECGHSLRNPNSPRQIISGSMKVHDVDLQTFSGECRRCGAVQNDPEIGNEPTIQEYVCELVAVCREVRRVLRDDGTVWLNLGDAHAGSPKGNLNGQDKSGLTSTKTQEHSPAGGYSKIRGSSLKPKNLIGIPWRVAFALQDDGWYLRSDVIWSKPNPMPESAKDRPSTSHEHIFMLSKSARYFYDAEAVRGS